ncbi:MAG TPA: outer membrane beta-barrel protein [Myxococcota bacterium]|nr:outer membrane beta-barrel protein [Myxococcota bacterium]
MRGLRSVLAAVLVSFAAHAARADDTVDFGRSGPYVGVGASRSVNLIEAFLDGTAVLDQIHVSDSWGVNVRAGYRAFSWLAFEAEYEWLDPFRAELGGLHIGSIGFQSATANMKFIIPIRRFQPYLLLGAGALFTSIEDRHAFLTADHSAFAGRLGVGFDVYLTQNLVLNSGVEGVLSPAGLKLTLPQGTFSENGLGTVTFQLGLAWRF